MLVAAQAAAAVQALLPELAAIMAAAANREMPGMQAYC
jgi:hypothetical protein